MRLAWLISLLVFASNAFAYRVEFIAQRNNERITGAEVCLHRAADGRGPAAAHFASATVTCLPADDIIDIPAGFWSACVRHADGWVSSQGTTLVRRGPREADRGYHSINVELQPAAYISFENIKPSGNAYVAFAPMRESSRYGPAFFPLSPGESRVPVPAWRDIYVVTAVDGAPRGIGRRANLVPGEVIDAVELISATSDHDLFAWIDIDPASIHDMAHASVPVVRLIGGDGTEYPPIFDWDSAGAALEGLVAFEDIPEGILGLRLRGRDWRTSDLPYSRPSDGGAFVSRPLIARLRHTLSARWSLPASFASRRDTCDPQSREEEELEWEAQLFRCATDASGAASSQCTAIAARTVDPADAGTIEFDVRETGSYAVVLASAAGPIAREDVVVESNGHANVTLQPSFTTVFGRVTVGGVPMAASIAFETGRTVSDDDGSYVAVLQGDPLDNAVEVRRCGSGEVFTYIPDVSVTGSRHLDIAIPDNEVVVRVLDASKRTPISGAAVGRGLHDTIEKAAASSQEGDLAANDDGEVVIRGTHPGLFMRVCAAASGYASTCAEPIAVTADMKRTLDVVLPRIGMTRGKISGLRSFEASRVYALDAGGGILGEFAVSQSGDFEYPAHVSPFAFAIVGVDHPLIVLPAPPLSVEGGGMVLTVPPARVRALAVELDETMPVDASWFTISVGAVDVPLGVLSAHATRRGNVPFVEKGERAVVSDIAETAALSITAIVARYPAPAALGDLFVLPQFAAIRERRAVPEDGLVVYSRRR